jgi:hypothetical protein
VQSIAISQRETGSVRVVFKAQIVIASNNEFMPMRKFSYPYAKCGGLCEGALSREIASMNEDVSRRDDDPFVHAVSVRNGDDAQRFGCSHDPYEPSTVSQFLIIAFATRICCHS